MRLFQSTSQADRNRREFLASFRRPKSRGPDEELFSSLRTRTDVNGARRLRESLADGIRHGEGMATSKRGRRLFERLTAVLRDHAASQYRSEPGGSKVESAGERS